MSARYEWVRALLYAALGVSLFVPGWRLVGELTLAVAVALLGVVMTIVRLHGDLSSTRGC